MFTQNNYFHIKQDTVISTGLYRRKSGPSQDHTDPDITQSKQEVEALRGPVHPVHQRGPEGEGAFHWTE